MKLGDRIKLMRELRGLSQTELANRVPMLQATLSALETRSSVRSEFLFGLAEGLEVPPKWLSGGDETLLAPHDRSMVKAAMANWPKTTARNTLHQKIVKKGGAAGHG